MTTVIWKIARDLFFTACSNSVLETSPEICWPQTWSKWLHLLAGWDEVVLLSHLTDKDLRERKITSKVLLNLSACLRMTFWLILPLNNVFHVHNVALIDFQYPEMRIWFQAEQCGRRKKKTKKEESSLKQVSSYYPKSPVLLVSCWIRILILTLRSLPTLLQRLQKNYITKCRLLQCGHLCLNW